MGLKVWVMVCSRARLMVWLLVGVDHRLNYSYCPWC